MVMRKRSRRRNPQSGRSRRAEELLHIMPIDAFEKFAYFVKRHSSTWKDEITHDYPLTRAPREAVEILGSYADLITLPMVKRVALHRLRSGSPWLVVSGSTAGLGLRRRNPSDLEVREKFDRCVASVRAKSGKRHLTKSGRYARISRPEAVCAKSIRRTSRKQLARISAEGRSLAAARRHRRGLVRSRKTGRLVHRPMSRIRKTAIERRGLLGRVMRQQKIAKIRARRQMARRRNPSTGMLHFKQTNDGRHAATHGKFLVVLTPRRVMGSDVVVAHVYHNSSPVAQWIFDSVHQATRDITKSDLSRAIAKR